MVTLLEKLARATDTKGYPDDKNPAHWRKINGSPVHLDANGNIDGGAGGKFGGKAWKSTKHPHIPASYPKPKTTLNDLKTAWAKVAKYHVAMKRAKTQATHQKQQQNMLKAISDYQNLAKQADPKVAAQFKPNVALAQKNASAQFGQQSQPQSQPKTQQPQANTQQNPLQALASATAPRPGRNVKIYNMGQRWGASKLRKFANDNGLNIPAQYYNSSDPAVLGKAISQELTKRNQNYGHYTVAQTKTMKSSKLFQELRKVPDSKLNPLMSNKYLTQRLSMALGNNEPPRLVSRAEFKKMTANNKYPVIYRGVTDSGDYSATDIINDTKYGDANWLGGSACIWGVGLYMTTSDRYAKSYASRGGLMRATIDPARAKVIDWDTLVDLARTKGIRGASYTGGGSSTVRDQLSAIALQMGFNVIKITKGNAHSKGASPAGPNSSCGDFYNVLDRSCLVMEK